MNIPEIIHESKRDIIGNISMLARSYVPEWRFTEENPDIGSVIALIFADMFEGTIKRYNHLFYKHHIAFLNNLDISVKPSVPAKGVVCFEQSADFITGVHVPARTKLIASSGTTGESLVFETQRGLFITPASISSIVCDYPSDDKIALIYDGKEDIRTKRMSLFNGNTGENLQKHFFALCHKYVLNTCGNALIRLSFELEDNSRKAMFLERISNSKNVRWLFYNAGEWKQFGKVEVEDDFIVLGGEEASIEKEEYEGTESCWIGCESTNLKELGPVGFKSLKIKADRGDIAPEVVYADDTEQEQNRFFPFGEELALYRECYIACREALSKANSKITLSFTLSYAELEKEQIIPPLQVEWKIIIKRPSDGYVPEKVPVVCDRVVWEYWNGLGWARLNIDGEAETVFDNGRAGEIKLSFRCPENMQPILVNAFETYWIRMRLVASKNIFMANCRQYAPEIKNLKLEYSYEGRGLPPEKVIASNNTAAEDITGAVANASGAVLFKAGTARNNSLYIGFDRYPEGSPISIYFNIDGKKSNMPVLEWEYYSAGGKWKEFKLSDKTNHFADPGIVTLIIPEDLAAVELYGINRYWLRIIDVGNEYRSLNRFPVVKGIYINSVEVLNEETVEEEVFFVEEKKAGLLIHLSRENILELKVMVNEQGMDLNTSSEEYAEAVQKNQVEAKKDTRGNVNGIWILWHEVDSFITSGPEDRHYIVNRISGEIIFGDGKKGKIPPKCEDEAIRVLYSIGGGKEGNLEAGGIDRLADAMRFVSRVYNPAATHGGSNCEDIDTAVQRGANMLKHNIRAVTEEDFEALAMEASRNIAKVKCVSNISREGGFVPGRVTVAVLLDEYNKGRDLFLAQRDNISNFLCQRAGCTIANGGLTVIEPVFLKLSVKLWFKVKEVENIYEIQRIFKEKINGFIDPLKGNFNNCGWNIGELPNKSRLYSFIKSLDIDGSVERLIVTVSGEENDRQLETESDDLKENPFYMGINGIHDIVITFE